jgi:hypothetical protein
MEPLAKAVLEVLGPVLREMVMEEVGRVAAVLAPADSGDRLYSVAKAAERLDESPTSTRRRLANGSLGHVLVPGRVNGVFEQRVRQSDIDAFISLLSGGSRPPSAVRTSDPSSTPKARRRSAPKSLAQLVQDRVDRNNGVPADRKSSGTPVIPVPDAGAGGRG